MSKRAEKGAKAARSRGSAAESEGKGEGEKRLTYANVMCPKVRSLFQREAQSCAWRIELSETVKRATDSLRWGQSQLTYLEEKGTEEEKKKDLEKLRGKVAKWTETLKNAKERLAKVESKSQIVTLLKLLPDPRRTALGYSLKRLRDDDDEEEKQNEEEKEQEVAAIGFDAVRQLLLQERGLLALVLSSLPQRTILECLGGASKEWRQAVDQAVTQLKVVGRRYTPSLLPKLPSLLLRFPLVKDLELRRIDISIILTSPAAFSRLEVLRCQARAASLRTLADAIRRGLLPRLERVVLRPPPCRLVEQYRGPNLLLQKSSSADDILTILNKAPASDLCLTMHGSAHPRESNDTLPAFFARLFAQPAQASPFTQLRSVCLWYEPLDDDSLDPLITLPDKAPALRRLIILFQTYFNHPARVWRLPVAMPAQCLPHLHTLAFPLCGVPLAVDRLSLLAAPTHRLRTLDLRGGEPQLETVLKVLALIADTGSSITWRARLESLCLPKVNANELKDGIQKDQAALSLQVKAALLQLPSLTVLHSGLVCEGFILGLIETIEAGGLTRLASLYFDNTCGVSTTGFCLMVAWLKERSDEGRPPIRVSGLCPKNEHSGPCSAMAYRRKCMSDDPWELTHKACRLLNGVIPFNPYSTLPPSEDWGSYSSEDERKDTGDDAWL